MKQLKKSSKKTKEIPTLQLPEEEVLKDPMLVAEEISKDDLRTGKFQYVTNAGQYPSGSLISPYSSSSKKKSEYFYSISMCTNLVSAKMEKFKERLTPPPGTPTNTQGESCLFLLVPLIMIAC